MIPLHPENSITHNSPLILLILSACFYITMATAQVVSATTALLHDEKIEEKPQEDIKINTDDQETTVTVVDDTIVAPESEPEAPDQANPEAEPEALAAEVETKVVIKEEEKDESKVSPVDQPAKVAPEPEPEAKETKQPEDKPAETEPTEVEKGDAEPESQPEAVAAEE